MIGDLDTLRDRAASILALFICFNALIIAALFATRHTNLIAFGCALGLAGLGIALARPANRSLAANLAMAAAATCSSLLAVSVAERAVPGDWYAYVFMTFALLVAFADWRPLALSTILTAFYESMTIGSQPSARGFAAVDDAAIHLFIVISVAAALAGFSRELGASIERTRAALAAREIFEAIVLKGTAGIGVFTGEDGSRTLAFANSVLVAQLGFEGDPIGRTTMELVGPEMTRGLVAKLRGDLNDGERNSLCVFPWKNDEAERWFEIDAYMVELSGGARSLVAMTTDVTALRKVEIESARAKLAEEINFALEREISERRAAEQKLAHAAYHDALTGLPNRALLAERLEVALRRKPGPNDRRPAALFVDLDGFKLVNDSFGHTIADLLLVGVARRFEACLRGEDTIARVGGDEFVIVLESVTSASATALAELLLEELAKPFDIGDRQVLLSASIGIAVASEATQTADDLVRDADIAMYRAKTFGKGRYDIFVDEMRVRSDRRTRYGLDLKHALREQQFAVYYQPIVSLVDGSLEGFEALLRWQHPTIGLVPPDEFIPIAEETGSIVDLGAWVLRTACTQLATWRRSTASGAALSVSVNVSAKQLLAGDFAKTVLATLAEAGLAASALHLEITETAVVHEPLRVAVELETLRGAGVSISLDDFGTGYSSMTYLKAFPIDSLKIDRSFVSSHGASSGDPEIVRSLIVLAKSLGLAVVAEGVETPEQEAQLRELGCTKAQGYLFARPLTTIDATSFISGVSSLTESA